VISVNPSTMSSPGPVVEQVVPPILENQKEDPQTTEKTITTFAETRVNLWNDLRRALHGKFLVDTSKITAIERLLALLRQRLNNLQRITTLKNQKRMTLGRVQHLFLN
jgi:hypothetical protein